MAETLQNLLSKLNAADDALIELSESEQSQMIADLAKKIDSYVYVLDHFDGRIATLKATTEKLKLATSQLQNNRDRLQELMRFHMETQGFDKLTGDINQVTLVSRKDVELTLPEEINKLTVFEYPEFVNMKEIWSWDKNKIKDAIKNDPAAWEILGRPVVKTSLRFGVKK